ncbi:hypothetical protein [Streptomyces sp. N35]|uniref:hypothetical protein n=1 Tax=Streptomyces sp. N35 TaxID=2795730 RepID=UPI0018F3E83B|nr:hypothetical protein [Streptomyces sp. N35]
MSRSASGAQQHDAEPSRRGLTIEVGTDPHTRAAVKIDLGRHPHILAFGGTGSGMTSTMALISAHAARVGCEVTLLDADYGANFEYFNRVRAIKVVTNVDAMAAAIVDFHTDVVAHRDAGTYAAAPQVMVIDGLHRLSRMAREDTHLAGVLRLLHDVLHHGGGTGHHLVADISQLAPSAVPVSALRERASTVVLPQPQRLLLDRADIDPLLLHAHPHTGVVREPGGTAHAVILSHAKPAELYELAAGR